MAFVLAFVANKSQNKGLKDLYFWSNFTVLSKEKPSYVYSIQVEI